ncbi:MAG: hypothetical protein PF638_05185 [Candidatus Delongbacteria bacterium]|jgi:DNA polymerase III gamma/tau subunit|nr:hypothetical protein [Candidatus Delongbacteria bacterium]
MNIFKDIFGQKIITENFSSAILNNKLHHAYLFTGPAGVGKEAVALEIIKITNCLDDSQKGACGVCSSCKEFGEFRSDDLMYIFPKILKKSDGDKAIREKNKAVADGLKEKGAKNGYYKFTFKLGRFITLDQINEIKYFSQFNSLSKYKKFIIISAPEKMNKEAQNALLKILEEPPANMYFFLISENPAFLLDTIISRCQNTAFPLLKEIDILEYCRKYISDIDNETLQETASRSLGSIDKLNMLITDQGSQLIDLQKEMVRLFLNTTPPESLRLIDTFIEGFKLLSDDDIEFIINGAVEKIIINTFKDEKKRSINHIENIIAHFQRFGYMYKRNINPKLLMINLYFNYREEFKKWKTNQI